jgi:hypothetical protein
MALLGCHAEPMCGLGEVGENRSIVDIVGRAIHQAHLVLSICVPLLGCHAEPMHYLRMGLRDSTAFGIPQGEVVLGIGTALLGCHAEPLHGVGIVLHGFSSYKVAKGSSLNPLLTDPLSPIHL